MAVALEVMITTPEGLVYEGEALKVVVPAHDGELGILPRHASLVAELGAGELRISALRGPGELSFFIAGGFAQVLRNRVMVLATRAELVAAIDPARAEEELKALLAEAPPAGGIEARSQRAERIRTARRRVALSARRRRTII